MPGTVQGWLTAGNTRPDVHPPMRMALASQRFLTLSFWSPPAESRPAKITNSPCSLRLNSGASTMRGLNLAEPLRNIDQSESQSL